MNILKRLFKLFTWIYFARKVALLNNQNEHATKILFEHSIVGFILIFLSITIPLLLTVKWYFFVVIILAYLIEGVFANMIYKSICNKSYL